MPSEVGDEGSYRPNSQTTLDVGQARFVHGSNSGTIALGLSRICYFCSQQVLSRSSVIQLSQTRMTDPLSADLFSVHLSGAT